MKLQRRFSILGVAALVLGVSAGAQAAPLVVFNFNDLNATADSVAANLTSSAFADGGGLTNESFATGAANARGWNPSDGAAEALANSDFWTFTVSAQPGYVFDVDSIALQEWRESAGPMEFQLFAGAGLLGSALSTNSLATNHVIGASSLGVTSLLIRILAWDASNNGTSADWFVDNVIVNGTVRQATTGDTTPVPEPASLLLFGAALTASARRLRARR
jgi:hypothetical protein